MIKVYDISIKRSFSELEISYEDMYHRNMSPDLDIDGDD